MTVENYISIAGVILSGVGIILSGFVGYFIKYFLDKKSMFSSKNSEIKREMYKEYVEIILSTLDTFQDQDGQPTEAQSKELVSQLKDFHKKAVLYASPKVLKAFSDMLQHSYREFKDKDNALRTMVLMTAIFKEMRKDIGLSNRGLGSGGIRLIRPLINDYDEVIRNKEFLLHFNARAYLSNNRMRQKDIENIT